MFKMKLIFGYLLFLPFDVQYASAAKQIDVIKTPVVAGGKTFKCTFNLVLLPSKVVNLKKSKISCSPKKPRHIKVKNLKLSGKLGNYLVSITINPNKIKSVEVLYETNTIASTTASTTRSTTSITTASVTTTSSLSTTLPESQPCDLGYSRVCLPGEEKSCPDGMYRFCPPQDVSVEDQEVSPGQSCSCLQTFLVQLAVQSSVSPLGCAKGCVCLGDDMERCESTSTTTQKTKTTITTVPASYPVLMDR